MADQYGVSKRAVTNLAKREEWQHRLVEVERKAREESDRKNSQTLEAARERHMKALRLVFGKGIETLNRMVIDSPDKEALRKWWQQLQE